MARVIITSGDGKQETRVLEPVTTIGRHPDNTVQLLDRVASKGHCSIDLLDGRYVLRDLGSLNGTFVNGERVESRVLQAGDEIGVGSTKIVFSEGPIRPEHSLTQGRAHSPRKVTLMSGPAASRIRSKLVQAVEQDFLPEKALKDVAGLRKDYEKLRVSYELTRAIGAELDVDRLLDKILTCAFDLLSADRGVILMCESEGELVARSVRTSGELGTEQEVTLSSTIIREVLKDRAGVLSSDASVDTRFKGAHSVIMQGIRSTIAVPLIHGEQVLGVMVLDSQVAANAFTEKDLQLTQTLANQAAIAIQNSLYAREIQQQALTRQRFQRLLSPAIAEQVIKGDVDVAKGGQLRDTTVFFSDIRGFTRMAEARNAQEIVNMLNQYFELMVEVIFKNEGTLDKFVGDAIMALFGSPVQHDDDAVRAVRTAVEQFRVLEAFNRARLAQGSEPLRIGIGIDSGEVVAGYLGSSKALEYTAIGDVVNTASRLCSLAKAGEIIISERTWARIHDRFDAVELPRKRVKGKSRALKLYRVVREKSNHREAGDSLSAGKTRNGSTRGVSGV
ncbi:MAG: FHA domain-containing protein [Proteobacteria bacterium]|nr:FHA domain-containing protein [Pseudomonadota bacterium]